MKAATPVQIDIFELVLEFYRAPSDYPDLLDSQQPLPDDISDLLELTAGEVAARSKILTRASASESPSELIDATSYFTEQVLFAPGGDHYRVLGLNHSVTKEQIQMHYELLVSLFYQDKDDNSIQSNEADFSRLNRAYSVLREDSKRAEYDKSLKSQGRYHGKQEEVSAETTSNKTEEISTAEVHSIGSYLKTESADSKSTAKSDQNKKHAGTAVKSGLPKILIVDDSATVRAGLSLTLNKEFECVTAKNGEKGWEILQKNDDILLVLSDLEMPVMNGYDFTSKIRASDIQRINKIPVIIVTGTEDLNAKQKALTAGADDFLAKSTDYIEVLTRVRVHHELVETRRMLAESKLSPPAAAEPEIAMSPYEDDHVPILTDQKNVRSQSMPMGAFALIAVVIITVIYFTQSTPEKPADEIVENSISSNESDVELANLESKDMALQKDAEEVTPVLKNTVPVKKIPKKVVENKIKPAVIKQKTKKEKQIKKPELLVKKKLVQKKPVITKPVVVAKPAKKIDVVKDIAKVEVAVLDKPQVDKPLTSIQEPVKPDTNPVIVKKTQVEDTPVITSPVSEPEPVKADVSPVVIEQTISAANDPVISGNTKSISGRLPTTDGVPSVNRIAADVINKSVITDIATQDQFVPAEPAIVISRRELSSFIFRFIRSYENGNLPQFMALFDEFAVTEDRTDTSGIRDDYKDLFDKSAARRFILGDLRWDIENDKASGKGFFEVQIWPKGSDTHQTFTGELSIVLFKKEKGGLVITELFHNF